MIVPTFFISILAWSAIRCEPPVNSYLPPSNSASGRPSSQYGPPGSGGAPGHNQQGSGAQFSPSNQPQSSYLPPGRSDQSSVDTQYGPPSSGGFGSGSSSQGQQLRQGSGQAKPDSQYGTPNQNGRFSSGLTGGHSQPGASSNSHPTSNSQGRQSFGNGGSSNGGSFGPDNQNFDQKPGSSYNPSTAGFRSSNSDSNSNGNFGSHAGGARLTDGSQSSFSGTPSSSYGTPGFGGNGASHGNGGGSGSGFGGGNGGFGGDDSNEPAKYQFSYDVDDEQTGTKFGHSEQRDGDLATGEYNVVLPDGRKQVVEYEAGLEGYKPQIRYEGTGNGGSRQGSGSGGFGESQRLSQGYTENGPNEGGFQSNNVDSFGGSGEQTFGQLRGSNAQAGNGYPSGRQNGQNQGYPNGGSGQNGNQGNNGANRLNGGSQGYPSGGPRGNGRGSTDDPGNFSNASGRGSSRNSGGTSGSDGYPSGGPNGLRGSGY